MSILKIALTGGIACGKSEVSYILKALGAKIIDLDEIAKEVVRPNSKGLADLIAYFDRDILNKNGTLNRTLLKKMLFTNLAHKRAIENILHPKIIHIMQQKITQLEKTQKIVIVVVPLLVEANISHLFDQAIVVTCTPKEQKKRILARDKVDNTLIDKILVHQVDEKKRIAATSHLHTYIIENKGTILELEIKTHLLWQELTYLF